MSYQEIIIKVDQNFEGKVWVEYDRCYRRQVVATKSLGWAKIDTALNKEAFTGRARSVPRCNFCLSLDYSDHDCPACPMPVRDQPTGKVFLIGGGAPCPPRPLHYWMTVGGPPAFQEICQLFNSARCRVFWCKRQLVCNPCGLPHLEKRKEISEFVVTTKFYHIRPSLAKTLHKHWLAITDLRSPYGLIHSEQVS